MTTYAARNPTEAELAMAQGKGNQAPESTAGGVVVGQPDVHPEVTDNEVADDRRVHSVYADGTRVLEGEQPGKIAGPDPNAEGPHSVVQWDETNGRIYKMREFGVDGSPVRDVDMTNPTFPNGTPRPDHPGPPHQHVFMVNSPDVGPRSGYRRGGPEPIND
jgi:hypothetical protein